MTKQEKLQAIKNLTVKDLGFDRFKLIEKSSNGVGDWVIDIDTDNIYSYLHSDIDFTYSSGGDNIDEEMYDEFEILNADSKSENLYFGVNESEETDKEIIRTFEKRVDELTLEIQ